MLAGTDARVAPVLRFTEAPSHPADVASGTDSEVDGVVRPAPAPCFPRTPATVRHGTHSGGKDTDRLPTVPGLAERESDALKAVGSVA